MEREKLTLKVYEEKNDYGFNDGDLNDVPYILIHLGKHGMMKVCVDGDGVNGYIIDVYDMDGEVIHTATIWEEDIVNGMDDNVDDYEEFFWYKLMVEKDGNHVSIGDGYPTRHMAVVELNKYAEKYPKQNVYVDVVKQGENDEDVSVETIFPLKRINR